MALNPNHTFEELGETKCSVVEKNCGAARADFLKNLLELNGFTAIVVKSPPPKTAPKLLVAGTEPPAEPESPLPETFTVGVSDLSFNPMNAIYNRELKTPDGKIVTPNYWKQLDTLVKEDSWYWKE
jgi:hypothetical protein